MHNFKIKIILILHFLFGNWLVNGITDGIFYVDTSTDTILLKCSGLLKDQQSLKKNYIYNKFQKVKLAYENFEKNETWFFYNLNDKLLLELTITCKDVVDSNNSDNTWAGQLKWKSPPDPLKYAIPLYGYKTIENSCPNSNESKTVEAYIDIDGILQVGTPREDELYKNQLRYLFLAENYDDKKKVLHPCRIYKTIFGTPNIYIYGEDEKEILNNDTVKYFILKPSILQSYKVVIKVPNLKLNNFYSLEKVYVNNVKYNYDNKYIVNDDNLQINGRFDVERYGIFEFTYICDGCGIDDVSTNTSKTYFFGPQQDNEILKSEYHLYMHKKLSLTPNCSLDEYSFAYLEKVSFENDSVDIGLLKKADNSKLNGFKLNNNLIIYTKSSNPNGTLICYYKTPIFYVLEKYTFIVVYPPNKLSRNEDNDYVITRYQKNPDDVEKLKQLEGEHDILLEVYSKLLEKRFQLEIYRAIIGILIVLFFITIIGLLVSICFIRKRTIKNYIFGLKIYQKHPNVYEWCDELNKTDCNLYCKLIYSENYIPEKLSKLKENTIIQEGEEVEGKIESLFSDTLVASQKGLDVMIQAHYINIKHADRVYIISDQPTPQLIPQFWEMIYNEDISVSISFSYRCPGDNTSIWRNFWPHSDIYYDDLKIFKGDDIDSGIPHITQYVYYIEKWREHDLPESTAGLLALYKLVSTTAGNSRVLVNSKFGVDSSTFIFVYFSCIVECMLNDSTLNNPMNIIKKIRECRYGGDIGAIEYAFLQKAIVDFFVTHGVLYDLKKYAKFSINYSNYIKNTNLRVSNVNSELRTFFTFANILDKGLVRQLSLGIQTVQKLDGYSLKYNCSRWYEIENDSKLRNKNRYHDIPCLDKNALYSGEWPIYNTDISSYINANEIKYYIRKDIQRRLILCQAPTKSTVNGVVDVMFKNEVGILVLLAKQCDRNEKWIECFPIDNNELVFGKYTVVREKDVEKIEVGVYMSQYYITDGSKKMPFKVLHLREWSSKGNPINAWAFLSLYRHTIKLSQDKSILIQCPNGVGWSGAFALIIYTIDKIGANYYFDPLKDLAFIREHRNGAVQTKEQMMIAFTVIRDYYVEHIKDNDFSVYKWYTKYYKNYLNKVEKVSKLTWGENLIDPLAKAGFNYEFQK